MGHVVGELEKTPFIESIIDDLVNHEQGKFILATGAPGSGKSMAMVRMSEKVDPHYELDRIVIGKTTQFLDLLESAKDGKLPHGSAIMLDEAGVGMPARDWNSAQNRVLSLIFQVIRKLGLLVVMTTPAKRMLDIHGQILMRYYATGDSIDYKTKRSKFHFYRIKYNDWDDRITRHLLRDANNEKVNMWEMALPNKSIDFKEYEEKKDIMIGELLGKARGAFTQLENEDNNDKESNRTKGEARIRIETLHQLDYSPVRIIKELEDMGAGVSNQYVYKIINQLPQKSTNQPLAI